MRIVDAQIHLWEGANAPPHHWRAPYTFETALRDMDEAGVHAAINCPAIWDADSNDYAELAARAHPERFATLGWFPLHDGFDEALMDDCLRKTGVLGLRFVMVSAELGERLRSGALDALWDAAHQRELPVGLIVAPSHLRHVGDIAARFPKMRLLIDHMAIGPAAKLPEAAAHMDALVALARHANIAIKATGAPGMAVDGYPFESTHGVIRQAFDAFGEDRVFWGTDITRMRCHWRECITLFTEQLPWLKGRALDRVMGEAVLDWLRWRA